MITDRLNNNSYEKGYDYILEDVGWLKKKISFRDI